MKTSEILSACREELFTAALADALDAVGFYNQTAKPGINALSDEMRVVGFARTGIYMPIFHDDENVDVYGNEIALIDSFTENDVAILACNENLNISPWGELLSTRAQFLKAAGCITDGSVRDVKIIREMGFPVFSGGTNPLDTKYRGKMMWADVPVKIGGALVNSGDLVMADEDGIVFVPKSVLEEVVTGALEKARAETVVRKQLRDGVSLAEVFASHGIL